ncbi:SAM-dependent methyltransferase [Saccharopolyspora montiporae]
MTETEDVDVAAPNIARMYDYLLGGSANFAVDRAAAEEFNAQLPGNADWAYAHAQANRAFLGRAVRHLATEHGIDQFLDLGSGVPTKGNVHEIAHQVDQRARVAYVDHEAVAVAHARRMLAGHERVTVTRADARDPGAVLAAPGVAGLLDFRRPVAVLAVAILEVIGDVDAGELTAAYRNACVPGSALVVSHMTRLSITEDQVAAFREMMRHTPTPHTRFTTRAEMDRIGTGYTWLEPGVVPLAHWRNDGPVSEEQAAAANSFGAVGVLR